jgi:phosphoserine phosphatase
MSELIFGPDPQWLNRPDQPLPFVITVCAGDELEKAMAGVSGFIAELPVLDQLRGEGNCSVTVETSPGEAWVLFNALRQQLPGVDIFMQPADQLGKRLLICDMDMTIVAAETLDEVASHLGIGDQIAAITDRAMRGEIDFNDALRDRIAMLKGQNVKVFDEVAQQLQLNPGAEQLLETCREKRVHTILISGGFAQVAESVADQLGFDEVHCNHLQINEGKLTGEVIDPIVNAQFKLELLQQRANALDIDLADCCAIGDGANDSLMIEAAGLGIAYYGKPILRSVTNCQINTTALDSAIHFMGL